MNKFLISLFFSCSLNCMTVTFEFSKIEHPDWQEIDAAPAHIKSIYDSTADHYLRSGCYEGTSTWVAAALAVMTKRKPLYKDVIESCINELAFTPAKPNAPEIMQLLLNKYKDVEPESDLPSSHNISEIVIQATDKNNTQLLEVLLKNGVDVTSEIFQVEFSCTWYKERNQQRLYENSLKVLNLLKKYKK